jgi:hypothetical protein
MSNLLTSAVIRNEALRQAENNLVISKLCDTQYNEDFEKKNGEYGKIGNSVNVRVPILVTGTRNNMAWVAANSVITENTKILVVDRSYTIPMSFSDGDLALKVLDFSKRYMKQNVINTAANLDSDIAAAVVNSQIAVASATSGLGTNGLAANQIGTPSAAGYAIGTYGVAITPDIVLQARQILLDQGCPDDGELYGVLSTLANRQLVGAQATLFNPLTEINKEYRKGFIGTYAGIEWHTSQSLVNHTNGVQPTLVVSAGNLTTGWAEYGTLTVTTTAGAINAGDVFQAAGVFLVNPLTKQPTATLAQFQVTQGYAIGVTSVQVSPAPISAGQYQNISATINGVTLSLTGGATLGVAGEGLGGVESLVFHREAIVITSPKLEVPKNEEMAEMISDEDAPIFRMRFLRSFDALGVSGVSGSGGVGSSGPGWVSRLDTIWGVKTAQPSWIIRIRN